MRQNTQLKPVPIIISLVWLLFVLPVFGQSDYLPPEAALAIISFWLAMLICLGVNASHSHFSLTSRQDLGTLDIVMRWVGISITCLAIAFWMGVLGYIFKHAQTAPTFQTLAFVSVWVAGISSAVALLIKRTPVIQTVINSVPENLRNRKTEKNRPQSYDNDPDYY